MIFILLLTFVGVSAFLPKSVVRSRKFTELSARGELDPDIGYGPAGSLLRQGPVPFVIRIAQSDTYDAAVEKYMAKEKCSRLEAQANMDAYFQDPNGWAGNKIREKNGGPKIDYINTNTGSKQLVLTGIWAIGIIGLFVRIAMVQMGQGN